MLDDFSEEARLTPCDLFLNPFSFLLADPRESPILSQQNTLFILTEICDLQQKPGMLV